MTTPILNPELSRLLRRMPGVPSITLDLSAEDSHTLATLRSHNWRVLALRYGAAAAARVSRDEWVQVVRADGRRIPLRSQSTPLVTVWDTLHCVEGELRALAEMHRVLLPGGVLLLALPHAQRRYTRTSLRTLTESVGFAIDSLKRTLRGRIILRAHRTEG